MYTRRAPTVAYAALAASTFGCAPQDTYHPPICQHEISSTMHALDVGCDGNPNGLVTPEGLIIAIDTTAGYRPRSFLMRNFAKHGGEEISDYVASLIKPN